MTVFRWVLLTLAAFRLTRLVTTDDITQGFRDSIRERFGSKSNWFTLVSCPWCVSCYLCSAVFLVDRYFWQPPVWLLAMVAAMSLVGYLGTYDERP